MYARGMSVREIVEHSNTCAIYMASMFRRI